MAKSAIPEGYMGRRVRISIEANNNLEMLAAASGIQEDEIVSLMLEHHIEVLNETIAEHLEVRAASFRALSEPS